MQQLRNTPFHERTSALCQPQNWRKWAGYFVVGSYEHVVDREYWAIRNSAALIDVSPLMKYMLKGKDAAALLHRVTTRNIHKLNVSIAGYIHADETRKNILAASGLPDNGSVLPDAINLNNIDDWFEFHQAVLK